MYHSIIPKFETLYTQVGSDIKFAPNAYQFDRDIGVDYILLEDLRPRGYKNANRIKGLDLEHTKHVLQKLAEFHAASACYVEHFGMFPEEFTVGFYSKNNTELLKQFNSSSAFLAQLKKWKNGQAFYEKLVSSRLNIKYIFALRTSIYTEILLISRLLLLIFNSMLLEITYILSFRLTATATWWIVCCRIRLIIQVNSTYSTTAIVG